MGTAMQLEHVMRQSRKGGVHSCLVPRRPIWRQRAILPSLAGLVARTTWYPPLKGWAIFFHPAGLGNSYQEQPRRTGSAYNEFAAPGDGRTPPTRS